MTFCRPYPRQIPYVYSLPALSFDCSPPITAKWTQQNPQNDPWNLQHDPSHLYNYLHPTDTPQQLQLPPRHVLDYLSPPMPRNPCSPELVRSPTPPGLNKIDSFGSSYASLQYAINPQPTHYAPRRDKDPFPSPPGRSPRPSSPGRAVCIGINYFNQKGEMKGPTDEARNLSSYLQQVKHYARESIILLTDDQNGCFGQPTKRNILNALHWLGEHAFHGERLVVYYSGHGEVTPVESKASSGRATQGQRDNIETIYPVDFRSFDHGMIKPNELENLLEPVRAKGARLTLILVTRAGVA